MRPHPEFVSIAWTPWMAKDIELLESVQEKFVRNVSGLKGKNYLEKLFELELMTLEDRRGYIDLVETYKIVYEFSCKDPTAYFTFTGSRSGRVTR